MEKLNERDLFKIFSFWQERATETVRHDGDVGMHSLYSPSFFFCSLFATLSSVRSFTMCLFHLSAVSRLHYYYQFNTYNTLIPAAVAVTESNRVTTTTKTTTRITQVLPPATAATEKKTVKRAFGHSSYCTHVIVLCLVRTTSVASNTTTLLNRIVYINKYKQVHGYIHIHARLAFGERN